MKTLLRFLMMLILVPAAVALIVWGLERRGVFNLDHIDIVLLKNSDQPRYMHPIVEELDAQFEKLRGESLWRLDLDAVNREVASLPWVLELHVRRNWPDRLEVKIVPKEVKFLFVGKNGQLFPVLEDGTFMGAVPAENLPDVVLLRGEDFVKNKELLSRALTALNEIPTDGSFSKKTISEIRYDSKEGFYATLMKDAVHVKLGDDQFGAKADRVSQVLDYLESRAFGARVIDANLTKKVLVRLRKGP